MSFSTPCRHATTVFLYAATSNLFPCRLSRTMQMLVSRFWPTGCSRDMAGKEYSGHVSDEIPNLLVLCLRREDSRINTRCAAPALGVGV